LDYTVEETSPSFCWYSKDNGTTNSSAEVSGTNFTGLTTDTGSNTWTVYCNDTSSNVGNDSITFNMTEIWFNTDYPSTNKSFRITEFINVSGTDFTLAGEPYTFLGADSYYLADYATNHTYDDDGNEINNSRQAVTEILNEAQYLNINVLRTWASSQGGEDSHWEVNESGGHYNLFEVNEPGNYSEEMFVALDWVIYEASQRDIRLQLVLINNWNDYGGMRWYVQQSPTTDKTYENVSSDSEDDWWTFHDQFYTDENCIKYYEDYINYTLNRTNTYSGLQYKDDPAIFSWLLANEPRAKTDGTGRDLIKNWATNMTTYIKSIDSNHLVGLGIEGWGYEETWGEGTDIIADHETTGVDFATFALHPAPWKYFAERSEHTGTSDDWVTEDVNTNTYVDWWTDDTGISYNNRWTGSNVPAYTPALARAEYDNWVEQNVAWANNLLGMPILLQEAGFPTAYSKTIKDRFYEQMIHNFYNTGGDGLMFWTMNHDDYYYSTDVDGDMDDGYGFYVSDDDFLNNKSESVLDAIDFTLKDNDGGSWITFLNNYKYNFVVSAGTAGDKIIASSTLYLNISNGTTWYQVSYTNSTSIIKNEVYTFTKQFNDTDVEAYWIIEVCSNLLCINSTSTYMQIQSETPTITLLYPDDNINYDVSTLDFNYSVTTDSLDISNCGLYINDSLNKTDATITKDITQTFEVTLPDNHYSWYVKCIDVDDNVNDSVTRNLIIDTTPPVYSDDSTNSTLAGTDIEHRLNWYDNIKLDGYIFQFCNGTWNGTDCLGGITWANNSFEMCREIIVSNVGLTTLTNSPAYINLTKDDDMLSNYDDLMFYDALCNEGGTMLDYEIGNYTVTKADIWVRIPSLPAEGKTISVYYKNNTAVSSGENPSRVWDDNHVMVHHFAETTDSYLDSTSNNNDGTSAVTSRTAEGKIGIAPNFDGNNDYIEVLDNAILDLDGSNMTIEYWVNSNDVTAEQTIIGKNGLGTAKGWNSEIYDAKDVMLQSGEASSAMDMSTGDNLASNNVWYYVVIVWDTNANNAIFYINSDVQSHNSGHDDMADWNAVDLNLYIGISKAAGVDRYPFSGEIDEVKVSNVARSSDWVKQSYEQIINQDTYVSIGDEQKRTGWVNDSWTSMTGTENWSNVTKTINSTVGTNYAWIVHANDTTNNWNNSETFTYVSTSLVVDTCTCPASGDWTIQCSDNCDIQACDMQTNNVLINGTGTATSLRNITNATRIRIQGGCVAKW